MHSDLELGPVLRKSHLFINLIPLRGELIIVGNLRKFSNV